MYSDYADALKYIDGLRSFELVSSLSRLHRVQGSEDLVVAVEHVAMALQEAGVEASVENIKGPLGLWEYHGIWEPRGWHLTEARVEKRRSDGVWETVASTHETPLVAMVHSPPGEIVGRAQYARPWHESGSGVAVTSEPGWEGYYVLTGEQGYEAVVGFHTGPGVRYWGLYPHPSMAPPAAPAVSLEKEKALSIVGETVRVSVDAEYTIPTTPILRAYVGEGPLSVLIVAHICHPRPGAHDNASGVATAVEAMIALQKGFSHILDDAGIRVEALLVPEWTGTAAAFIQQLVSPQDTLAGLSVDMVAANLSRTGGRLRLVASPSLAPNILEAILDSILAAQDPKAYGGFAGYEWGSDHDVLLAYSIPASMLNEWPDYYYHSSLDTPDKLSPSRLVSTAAAVAAAIVYMARHPVRAAEATAALHRYIIARQALSKGSSESAIAVARLSEDYAMRSAEALRTGEPIPKPAPIVKRGPPYSRTFIYHILRDRRLLHDSRLREAARLIATIASLTGDWEKARRYYELVAGRSLREEEEEAARKLAGLENGP